MKVIAEIQSAIDNNGSGEGHGLDNEVVDVTYYNGEDKAKAIAAMATIIADAGSDFKYTRHIGARITF
jgi:hypothetical protein